jgi:hypothetical protein
MQAEKQKTIGGEKLSLVVLAYLLTRFSTGG